MIAQGTIIGHRYRIIDLIGTGGMAHVYRAVNLSSRKIVAIKVLKDEYRNDAEFLRRFEREARAVLHLSHENIVRAFDVGETDGLPYIVLEFVDGRTLKEIIDELIPPKMVQYIIDHASTSNERTELSIKEAYSKLIMECFEAYTEEEKRKQSTESYR